MASSKPKPQPQPQVYYCTSGLVCGRKTVVHVRGNVCGDCLAEADKRAKAAQKRNGGQGTGRKTR